MPSKYVDTTAILHVIGTTFNNLELLDCPDKYEIVDEDFVEDFHKITFGAIYKLHELGAKSITIENVVDYLSSRPKSYAKFKENKGEEWLATVSESSSLDSFDYYYNRLKKFSLLRAYDNFGVDLTDIYDIDNIFDTKKKQQQEDILDNSTLNDIGLIIEGKIEKIREQYIENIFNEESVQAGENIESLIDKFKEHPEVGTPLYGPLVNTVTRGARLKKFYLRSAATGIGKAIPNDTTIPTPTGYRKIEDIAIGDMLFDKNGKPTKVLGVFPQGKKRVWQVTFEDGRTARCCEEHLWSVKTKSNEDYETKSLREIYNTFYDYDYFVPVAKAVNYNLYEDKEFHPYAIGRINGSKVQYNLGMQWQIGDSKFIPKKYKLGSIEVRLEILRGLLDTAGKVGNDGELIIEINSDRLAEDIKELCNSLGMVAFEEDYEDKILISVYCDDKVRKTLFKKRQKEINKLNECKVNYFRDYLKIIRIEQLDEEVEMTCFKVDNLEHLFLMNDFIVTHNTRSMIADACYIACDEIYDERFGWIHNGIKESVLFISTEQEIEEVQTMMLAFLSNVNEEHILNGFYENDEEERVRKAAHILMESPLYIEELPDFSLQDVEDRIRKNIREHEVKYVFNLGQ